MKTRFIPTSVHAAIDHLVGPALVAAPTVLGLRRTSPEGIVPRAVGGVEAIYSNLTDYEMSMKNVVPMRVHLALDAVGGATLALIPQMTGARARGKKHWVPHLAIGAPHGGPEPSPDRIEHARQGLAMVESPRGVLLVGSELNRDLLIRYYHASPGRITVLPQGVPDPVDVEQLFKAPVAADSGSSVH